MCASIASLLGFNTKVPDPPSLPPIVKAAPDAPKAPPPPKPLQGLIDKPKVEYMKKSSQSKAKRIGASDLKIPLNQQQSNAGTGGLNV
jgi:hypothetical protein|tara:strand:+ start:369 stop:632 length:264 start_codon:yes stop_codon:yes gene_type:complete